jgi:hypothetical protein
LEQSFRKEQKIRSKQGFHIHSFGALQFPVAQSLQHATTTLWQHVVNSQSAIILAKGALTQQQTTTIRMQQ